MTPDQIAQKWRKHLVKKLQDRYGLAKKDAQMKADQWLQWIGQPILPLADVRAAEFQNKSYPFPSGRSRKTAAARV